MLMEISSCEYPSSLSKSARRGTDLGAGENRAFNEKWIKCQLDIHYSL